MATPISARIPHDLQIVRGSEILSLAEGRGNRQVRFIDLPADAHRAMPNSALETFVRLSGGSWGRIVVIPLATQDALAYGRSFARNLAANGAGMISVLQLSQRQHADDTNSTSLIDTATGILLAAEQHAPLAVLLEATALLRRFGGGMSKASFSRSPTRPPRSLPFHSVLQANYWLANRPWACRQGA